MPKLSQKLMEELFFNQKIEDPSVVMGPRFGEDAAVIRLNEDYLVAHPDPISGAVENIGWLSINVPANDIAVTGARPRWATPAIQIPPNMSEKKLKYIVKEMVEAASDLGVTLIGGHTETVEGIDRPLITTTIMGITNKPVFTSSSIPGDLIIQIKEAGIEGSWILASDFREKLLEMGVGSDALDEAKCWREDISIVDTALKVKKHVSSMHDPTEGGVLQGLYEMAKSSGNDFHIKEDLMVRPETSEICEKVELNPLRLISSGCLMVTSEKEDIHENAKVIGRVEEGDGNLYYKGEKTEEYPNDELFKAIAKLKV